MTKSHECELVKTSSAVRTISSKSGYSKALMHTHPFVSRDHAEDARTTDNFYVYSIHELSAVCKIFFIFLEISRRGRFAAITVRAEPKKKQAENRLLLFF